MKQIIVTVFFDILCRCFYTLAEGIEHNLYSLAEGIMLKYKYS